MKHTVAKVFGSLCLALIVGMVAAGPAAASEPAETDNASECPASYVCFWSGKTYGQAECEKGLNCFSAFHGYELGWHALENINPQSVYNHTGEHWAFFPQGPFGQGFWIGPGQMEGWGSRWTGGFEMT
jgi:hypothetical protein